MANIHHAAREVSFKIVFYGAPFAGKTTNLRWIRSRLDASVVSPLSATKSAADKILAFHFVPRDVLLLDGYRARIELCAVPGEVVFNAPRELVLRDADGIVFVADSRWDAMPRNVESLENMRANLEAQNLELQQISHVLQFNKRDLPDAASTEYMNFLLNKTGAVAAYFPASAIRGENVFEPLNAVLQSVFEKFAQRHARKRPIAPRLPPARAPEIAAAR